MLLPVTNVLFNTHFYDETARLACHLLLLGFQKIYCIKMTLQLIKFDTRLTCKITKN